MLMMSRREGEKILIGEDIEVVIAHIGRSRVRVGIRAPRSIPVVAREIKLVREENLAAAESAGRMRIRALPLQVSATPGDKRVDRQEAGSKLERNSQCLSPSKPT
jgi:carbon storage regulator